VIPRDCWGNCGRMPSQNSEAIVHAVLQRIFEARKNAEISQERLAEISGVDLGVISRAEHLLRIPGMSSILDLAIALNLDPAALLGAAMKDVGGKQARK